MSSAVIVNVAVAWGDMDAFGHVNNTVYLRWFETARIAWLHRTGLLANLEGPRIGPILARSEIDYRVPVVFPDTVEVQVTPERVGTSSVSLVYSLRSAAKGVVVAEGRTVVVMIDYTTGKPAPLDEAQRARIAE